MDRATELAVDLAGRLAAELARKLIADYPTGPDVQPQAFGEAIRAANSTAIQEFSRLLPRIAEAIRTAD